MPIHTMVLGAGCVVAALVAGGLLIGGVRALLRLSAAHELSVLPAKPIQTVSFAEPGTVVLALRGKQFQRGFGATTFTLRSVATGQEVASEAVIVRGQRSSLAGVVTLTVRRFAVPQSGDYLLEAKGLSPDLEDSAAGFVFQRPHGMSLVVHIVWVVGSAALLLTSIVVGALLISGRLGRA